MKLTPEQKHSAVWGLLKKYLAEELDALRKKNDGALDADATNRLRGQIYALKKLDEMDAEHPVIESFGD